MYMKKEIPDYGDLMTMEQFINSVKSGFLTNYDGIGFYSDGEFIYEAVDFQDKIKSFSHVVWMNR